MIELLGAGMGALGSLVMVAMPPLFFAGVIGLALHAVAERRRRLERLAQLWGLEATGLELYGEYQGARVLLRHVPSGKNRPTRTVLEVQWPHLEGLLELVPEASLEAVTGLLFGPEEIELGARELDARWRILGEQEVARGILLDPGVRAALAAFDGEGQFRRGRFSVRRRGGITDASEDLLADGARLAGEVERARCAPWAALAAAHGLQLAEDARALSGRVAGREVAIRELVHDDAIHTEIAVTLAQPLPAGSAITRHGEGLRLGDPVLDGQIAVRGEAAVLAPRLTTDAGRGAVMAVIHAHPASEVSAERVILRARGRLMASLAQGVEDAVTLARVLDGGEREPRAARVPQRERQ